MNFQTDVAVATQHALTVDQQAAFLRLLVGQYQGAHIADYLAIAHDADGYLDQTEPFWEKHDMEADADLLNDLSGSGLQIGKTYLSYALLALVILDPESPPTLTSVALLAQRAVMWAKGYQYAVDIVRKP